ncbi:MAG TPA: FliH/SctL family protein [Acidimicrobiales bacterium]|nr:FliH/SctL family protein [Acidimicrobiales bacterium]
MLRGGDAACLARAAVTTPLSEVTLSFPDAVPAHHDTPAPAVDAAAAAYAKGLAAGRAEAEAESAQAASLRHEAALAKLTTSLIQSAQALSTSREAMLDELLSEISELVLALVRELIGAELALHEEPARSAIKRALRFAPPDTDLVVRLHPSAEIAAWELESLVAGRRIRVVEDDRVEPEGCILEVGAATIDAQIAPALERLRDALLHLHAGRDFEEVG